MACLILLLDSATSTLMGESKELSIDLKECLSDLNKSGKSLGAISKQIEVPGSTDLLKVVCVPLIPSQKNDSYRNHWNSRPP